MGSKEEEESNRDSNIVNCGPREHGRGVCQNLMAAQVTRVDAQSLFYLFPVLLNTMANDTSSSCLLSPHSRKLRGKNCAPNICIFVACEFTLGATFY